MVPGPALPARVRAMATAVMVLSWVSAMYSVPCRPRPTPVGASTNAAAFCCSGRPEAILVVATSRGARWPRSSRVSRSTVP
jgi:hypothetical protein